MESPSLKEKQRHREGQGRPAKVLPEAKRDKVCGTANDVELHPLEQFPVAREHLSRQFHNGKTRRRHQQEKDRQPGDKKAPDFPYQREQLESPRIHWDADQMAFVQTITQQSPPDGPKSDSGRDGQP